MRSIPTCPELRSIKTVIHSLRYLGYRDLGIPTCTKLRYLGYRSPVTTAFK
nr:MAG TPA: Mitochondrial 18 KDa protein (MTP18) [Bacteriophage sp.]